MIQKQILEIIRLIKQENQDLLIKQENLGQKDPLKRKDSYL